VRIDTNALAMWRSGASVPLPVFSRKRRPVHYEDRGRVERERTGEGAPWMSQQELEAIMRRLQAGGGPSPSFSVEVARRTWYQYSDDFIVPESIEQRADHIGDMAVEWVQRPEASAQHAVLYLHGGGYVCGSIASHRPITAELAKTFKGGVLSLDFRLAPEHPFPAALDDAVSGYRYLLDRGVSPGGIAIAGDSAGGGLAICTITALRQRGLPSPGAAWVISPWSDLTNAGQTIQRNAATDPIVFLAALTASRDLYLAGEDHAHPLATAAEAGFAGFPPLLIQVAATEILLDDAIRLARLAALRNVAVTLDVWPGMVHVWHLFARDLQEARDATAQAAQWLNARL
jgi:acetyl esterase/lipase